MPDAAVLIIDDDERGRLAYRYVLEERGYSIREAENGTEGLRIAREWTPSVVLLDLRMPDMDGLDVLDTLVQECPETPVLVISGRGTMNDVVQALRRGAWDFITKPVVSSEFLLRAVERALEKAALLRQNAEYSASLQTTNERLSAALHELRSDAQAARQLQFQLLPEDNLQLGPYTCSRRLFPSQVLSGDFLGYFPLGERQMGFYLADVAGHGAASAFITAILSTLVGKYRDGFISRGDETLLAPQQFLERLDADLVPLRLEQHITMFYGVLDMGTGQLVYSNAGGFPFPLLCNGAEVVELECAGRPLNLPGRRGFERREAVLEPGGRLLVASDGVLEIEPRRTHRERREALALTLRSAKALTDVLETLGLADPRQLRDDVALLFLRREERHA